MFRRVDLLNKSLAHDDNSVRHCHGFGLVVRYVNRSRVYTFVQFDDFTAHCKAKSRVKVAQRFVHKKQRYVFDNGASESHTLHLSAGQFLGKAIEVLPQVQHVGCGKHLVLYFPLVHFAKFRHHFALFVQQSGVLVKVLAVCRKSLFA